MSWEHFCKLGNVPEWYQNVNYKHLKVKDPFNEFDYFKMAKSFIKKPFSIVLSGDPGRGKTHFSFALMRGLLDAGSCGLGDLRFFKSKEFDDRVLQQIKQFGTSSEFLNYNKDYDFLFLDDFGVETSSDRVIRDYYDLIDSRLYNFKTTVISTNLTEKKLSLAFGDRISSRLKEFTWIRFRGADLRGENARL